MKVISRLLAVTALLFFAPLALAENKAEWLKDYDAAVKTAADKKKPVLVIFTNSTTCAPCKILKREVLSKPEFAKYAGDNLVLLQVDYAPYFDKENKKEMKEIEAEQNIPKELWMRGRGPWPWMFVLAPDGTDFAFDVTPVMPPTNPNTTTLKIIELKPGSPHGAFRSHPNTPCVYPRRRIPSSIPAGTVKPWIMLASTAMYMK